MKYLAVIQARCGSTRLPNKVLLDLCGKPVLQQMIERVKKSKLIDEVMVVTSIEKDNLPLIKLCADLGVRIGIGSENDVLDRFYQAAKLLQPEYVIRLTGDCPCVDPGLLDLAISQMGKDVDYCANTIHATFADGLDLEIIRFSALEKSWREAIHSYEREHVTQYIIHHPERFTQQNVLSPVGDFSHYRWTVDEPEDFELIERIYKHFCDKMGNPDFNYRDILAYFNNHPELKAMNQKYQRNEGLQKSIDEDVIVSPGIMNGGVIMNEIEMGKGQRLYLDAKKIIPGGTQLLSKRPEMFLPDLWPSYYSKAKGCRIWDLDNKEYIDVSYMGIGANVLGYANDEVDEAAKEAIDNGSMSTLNAPEEVYLAKKLVGLHPWAKEVRYAKAGGEAMALAARIARAYTGKDILLFCGYHGWHDWYLAANLCNKNALNDQHIAGLQPLGVPSGLAGTNLPFHYNRIEEFDALIEKHKGNIAAVIMEPIRNDYPSNGFLEKIRETTAREGIVLVFDEITAGFRLCTGGSHKVLGVEPDMAIFAKGMTNGYPLSAIIGRKDVMEASQGTFISSTFYTERIGFAATLKSIELYEKYKVWEKQMEYGELVQEGWRQKAARHGLTIEIGGIKPLSHFSILGNENGLVYKTFFTQEMLKRGYISSTAFYTSYAHSPEIIREYLENVDEVFGLIAEIEAKGEKVEKYLQGKICHSGFGRLN